MNNYLQGIISSIKVNHPVPQLLANLAGIRIPAVGQAIRAPHFIRDDDNHPSFAVYEDGAFDFATGTYYDAISLTMAARDMSFTRAVEYLYGSPVFNSRMEEEEYGAKPAAQKQLDRDIAYWHDELLKNPEMLEYLKSRRITEEFISQFNLGWSKNRGRIMIPFTRNGRFVGFIGRDMVGEPPKYKRASLTGPGSECRLNVPWGLQTLKMRCDRHYKEYEGVDGQMYRTEAKDPRDDTLVVTEGCFDGFSFAQEGWQVIATCGGNIPRDYASEFFNIASSYRQVFVCFDSDKAGNAFQRKMCRDLFNAHINFICGHLPQGVKDVSDYYVAGGDLAELVKNATPGLIEMAYNVQTIDELSELFTQAALWVPDYKLAELREACYQIPDEKTIRLVGVKVPKFSHKLINQVFASAARAIPECVVAEKITAKHTLTYDDSGTFYEYKNGIWGEISEFIVHRYVGEILGLKASSHRMRNVANYLKASLAERTKFNRRPLVVLQNGTLHLDEMDPAKAFRPHSQSDMSTQSLSFNYDPSATAPKWEKFIDDVTKDNPAKRRLMQQIAGYVLCPDNRLQRFFYLLGDGSNGKSVFLNVLEAVYGPENCSSVQPSRLSNQFDPIALKDSMLNLCYEARVALNGAEEALKAVTSGDAIMAAHKGVDAVKFSTRAKFIIAANKCFASEDVSFGFLRRIIFLKFDQQFTGERANKHLTRELLDELPGIFNWCYAGYLDLMSSGDFEELEDSADVLNELMTQMSPTILFVREMLPELTSRQVNQGVLSETEMYGLYKDWCDNGGFKRLNRIEFMKDMGLLLRQMKSEVKITANEQGKRYFILPRDPEIEETAEESAETGCRPEADSVIALDIGVAQGSAGQEPGAPEAEAATETVAVPAETGTPNPQGTNLLEQGEELSLETRGFKWDVQKFLDGYEWNPRTLLQMALTGDTEGMHPLAAESVKECRFADVIKLRGKVRVRNRQKDANMETLHGLSLGEWAMLYRYYLKKPGKMQEEAPNFWEELDYTVESLKLRACLQEGRRRIDEEFMGRFQKLREKAETPATTTPKNETVSGQEDRTSSEQASSEYKPEGCLASEAGPEGQAAQVPEPAETAEPPAKEPVKTQNVQAKPEVPAEPVEQPAQKPVKTQNVPQMSKAEVDSYSTHTYETFQELLGHYKCGVVTGGLEALTLGDWLQLYQYFSWNPKALAETEIDFIKEYNRYVPQLTRKLRGEADAPATTNP